MFFVAFCRKCVGIDSARRLRVKKKPELASGFYLQGVVLHFKNQFSGREVGQNTSENTSILKNENLACVKLS